MIVNLYVEGKSEEKLFTEGNRFQQIILGKHTLKVIVHQGKGRYNPNLSGNSIQQQNQLLTQIHLKLNVATRRSNLNELFVVLFDADDNLTEANKVAQRIYRDYGSKLNLVVAIAIEETEAFYFGNVTAVKAAFGKKKLMMSELGGYTEAAGVGTWERFQRLIGETGAYKVTWAEKLAKELFLNLERVQENKSPSFQKFLNELKKGVGENVLTFS